MLPSYFVRVFFVFALIYLSSGMVAGFVRAISPSTKIIAGGVFVSSIHYLLNLQQKIYKSYRVKLLLDEGVYSMDDINGYDGETQQLFLYKKKIPVDAFIVNVRGESTLLSIIKKMEANEDWKTMENVFYLDQEGSWKFNKVVDEPYMPIVMDWSKVVPADSRAFLPVQVAQV